MGPGTPASARVKTLENAAGATGWAGAGTEFCAAAAETEVDWEGTACAARVSWGTAPASSASRMVGTMLVASVLLARPFLLLEPLTIDRKSTRLNSSHLVI